MEKIVKYIIIIIVPLIWLPLGGTIIIKVFPNISENTFIFLGSFTLILILALLFLLFGKYLWK